MRAWELLVLLGCVWIQMLHVDKWTVFIRPHTGVCLQWSVPKEYNRHQWKHKKAWDVKELLAITETGMLGKKLQQMRALRQNLLSQAISWGDTHENFPCQTLVIIVRMIPRHSEAVSTRNYRMVTF